MAEKVVLEAEVKSNIGEVSKDASSLAGEFQIMGVSLNSVKAGFVSIGKTAKASFATIKAGIASTGIGALLIAFGSLATFFTRTKKGAELLEVAFAGLGAAVSVIVDRVSKFGGAIVKLFQGDAKGALQDVKGAFKGIGDEIVDDTKQSIALKKAFQNLRDSQRELNVETAKQRAEIEKLKLIAEDVTKSTQERLDAAQKAFDKENKLLDDRIANAREDLRIQREGMELRKVDGKNTAEDLDREAELRIALFDIIGESSGKQIELNNKINSIQAEGAAKQQEIRDAEKIDIVEMTNLFEQNINKRIELLGELAKAEDINFGKKKTIEMSLQELSEKRIEWAAMTENERLNLAKNTFNDLTKIAGEETEAGKALAITATTIDTYQSAQASYKSLAGIPVIGPVLGGIAAAAAVAMGLKNIASIRSANSSTTPTTTTMPDVSQQGPAPQMMSGAFDLTGGIEPEAMRAYVLTDEMTNSQNQLANIRRRATI